MMHKTEKKASLLLLLLLQVTPRPGHFQGGLSLPLIHLGGQVAAEAEAVARVVRRDDQLLFPVILQVIVDDEPHQDGHRDRAFFRELSQEDKQVWKLGAEHAATSCA